MLSDFFQFGLQGVSFHHLVLSSDSSSISRSSLSLCLPTYIEQREKINREIQNKASSFRQVNPIVKKDIHHIKVNGRTLMAFIAEALRIVRHLILYIPSDHSFCRWSSQRIFSFQQLVFLVFFFHQPRQRLDSC